MKIALHMQPPQVENLLDTYDGVSPVHSHFYLLASDLHKIQGKHALFYRASLRCQPFYLIRPPSTLQLHDSTCHSQVPWVHGGWQPC